MREFPPRTWNNGMMETGNPPLRGGTEPAKRREEYWNVEDSRCSRELILKGI